jgi:GNAT superfamily N-acetyltransferase
LGVNAPLEIRSATDGDVPLLVSFRSAMFRSMGWTDEARLEQLAPLYAQYVREATAAGDFVAWVAEKNGVPVGGIALLWERVPPTVRNLTGRQAYILAAFVDPAHRRQGIAHVLVETAIAHATQEGAQVISLHYSPAGRRLYEKFGFAESPEMRLFTEPSSAMWKPVAPDHVPADDAD